MQLFLQQILNGVVLGGMFALMSVGLSMIFGVMKTAQFAYGALYMLGGYVAYWSASLLHIPFVAAVGVAFLFMFAAGMAVEYVGFSRLRGNEDATLIFGLGLALIARGGAVIAWGSQGRFIATPFHGAVRLGPFIVPAARMWAGVASFVIVALVYVFMTQTRYGRSMRAVADNAQRASLLGINTALRFAVVFGLGTALSAVACVFLIPVFTLSPTVDDRALYTAFAVVILDGLGSIVGCVAGAMVLGVVTTMAFGYTNSSIAPAFPLLVLLLTLAFRPDGMFGARGRLA
jgi:branched-chain amino acid transport system permease protein